jgi:hypothetical protein
MTLKNVHEIKIFPAASKIFGWKTTIKWEEIFANHVSDMGLVSRLCKELSQLNNKRKII